MCLWLKAALFTPITPIKEGGSHYVGNFSKENRVEKCDKKTQPKKHNKENKMKPPLRHVVIYKLYILK